MNRRQFLATSAAAAVASQLPAPLESVAPAPAVGYLERLRTLTPNPRRFVVMCNPGGDVYARELFARSLPAVVPHIHGETVVGYVEVTPGVDLEHEASMLAGVSWDDDHARHLEIHRRYMAGRQWLSVRDYIDRADVHEFYNASL